MPLTLVGLKIPPDEQAQAIFGGGKVDLAQVLGHLNRAGDFSHAIAPAPTWGE